MNLYCVVRAMVLPQITALGPGVDPLVAAELPIPEPGAGEVLIKVSACGVCHTELDEIEGRTAPARFPAILGHQVVGIVAGGGSGAPTFAPGTRVGVGWFFSSCGQCALCLRGRENLCPRFAATGRDAPGGYAEYLCVPEGSAFPLPASPGDCQAAPLLCAGAVGYRALRQTALVDGESLGLIGFGASAHLVLQLVRFTFPSSPVYVFAREPAARHFALELGATWAGPLETAPPIALDAAIDTTPAWYPVLQGLSFLAPAGRLVINAIRKEDGDRDRLLGLTYTDHLWHEKELKTVANVTPADMRAFLELAGAANLTPTVDEYALDEANAAIRDLRAPGGRGARVLRIAL